jgi:hypothetical protein
VLVVEAEAVLVCSHACRLGVQHTQATAGGCIKLCLPLASESHGVFK